MVNTSSFIIPFASSLDEACQATIKRLALQNLSRFLRQADLAHLDKGDEFDFIPPHERVLQASMQVVVTPCHWSVGIDNIRMDNPVDLELTDGESRALLAAVLPYFESDGILLTYDQPLRWLAQGEALSSMVMQGIRFASLDRVIGRNVDVWQPKSDASKAVRRLQNEIQMLLYTHPMNDAREAHGLPTVNSFWLSHAVNNDMRFDFSLRDSALRGDWKTWSQAWEALDKKLSQATQITLCGERHSIRLAAPSPRTLAQKAKRLFQPKPSVQSILESL